MTVPQLGAGDQLEFACGSTFIGHPFEREPRRECWVSPENVADGFPLRAVNDRTAGFNFLLGGRRHHHSEECGTTWLVALVLKKPREVRRFHDASYARDRLLAAAANLVWDLVKGVEGGMAPDEFVDQLPSLGYHGKKMARAPLC